MTDRVSEVGESLTSSYVLEYAYKRSLGPVLGTFFSNLKNRKVVGVRGSDGRVLVPPREYDPLSAEPLHEFVSIAECGVVTSWSWVSNPRPKHPLQTPFAWVLVRLDGASTSLLHVLDVPSEAQIKLGLRVRVRWADKTVGYMTDIACFELEKTP